MSPGVGYACAIASTLLSGSWQATTKIEAIQKHKLHPFVLINEVMLGFFVISWLALLPDAGFTFTPWGLLAGALFDTSMMLNIAVSFPVLGIAVGSGISSCVVCLTSLFWSAAVFKQSMRSIALASVGVVVVIVGLASIILTGRYFAAVAVAEEEDSADASLSGKGESTHTEGRAGEDARGEGGGGGGGGSGVSETSPLVSGCGVDSSLHASDGSSCCGGGSSSSSSGKASAPGALEEKGEESWGSNTRFRFAVAGALCAGIFGGSYLMPEHIVQTTNTDTQRCRRRHCRHRPPLFLLSL